MSMILCGRKRCCPSINKIKYGYEIKDDYGGKIKLTKEEMEILKNCDLSKV